MENTLFYTAADIAKLLKVSKALAYRLIAEKKIPSVRIGKAVRVKSDALQRFINEHSTDDVPEYNWSIAKGADCAR